MSETTQPMTTRTRSGESTIGDEPAVSRALSAMPRLLLDAADDDIEGVTHARPELTD
jgi:hypothetical protein